MTRPNLRELIRMGRAVETTTDTTTQTGEQNAANLSVNTAGTLVTLMAKADGGTLEPVVEASDGEGNWFEVSEFSGVTIADGDSIAQTETVAAEEVRVYAKETSSNLDTISIGVSL